MVSATVADNVGFDALYMSGYGISASHLGLPDAGLASFAEMLDRARTIAGGTQTPLIADADTGFGGLVNVRHTVQGYEQAGVAAIQLEDQDFPKKCGHAAGRTVIPTAEMVRKVEVAVESRTSTDFLIIARTDARSSLGINVRSHGARRTPPPAPTSSLSSPPNRRTSSHESSPRSTLRCSPTWSKVVSRRCFRRTDSPNSA